MPLPLNGAFVGETLIPIRLESSLVYLNLTKYVG